MYTIRKYDPYAIRYTRVDQVVYTTNSIKPRPNGFQGTNLLYEFVVASIQNWWRPKVTSIRVGFLLLLGLLNLSTTVTILSEEVWLETGPTKLFLEIEDKGNDDQEDA